MYICIICNYIAWSLCLIDILAPIHFTRDVPCLPTPLRPPPLSLCFSIISLPVYSNPPSYPAWRNNASPSLCKWSGLSGLKNGVSPHRSLRQSTLKNGKTIKRRFDTIIFHSCFYIKKKDVPSLWPFSNRQRD